ncbi:MAG TPA: PA domain-containing protein, partial [Cyclobacteriaceae bacterium]|nr:PA domain-containing protein [Cyclobacteriaceae bacterium]
MKKLSALFIACMLLVAACKTESTPETFARINAEVLQNSKAYATLGEATSTIGHRLTGSENGKKAEEYTFNKFKEYGFDDVQYQEFETRAWSRGTIHVTIDGDSVKAVTLGHAPVESDVTGELIDMGNGLEADYAAKPGAAKDKLILIYIGVLEGSPEGTRNLHRSEKTAIAIKNGAKGVVIFNQVDNGVLLTGTASVTGELIPVPAICIAKEKGFALKEKLKTGKKIQAHIAMTNHSDPIK